MTDSTIDRTIDRTKALELVVASLRATLEQFDLPALAEITEETVFVGQEAVLDSVGVVSLIVEVEQRLEMEHGILVTLANDKAMSQRSSPFRTVGVLADHVCAVIQEGKQS